MKNKTKSEQKPKEPSFFDLLGSFMEPYKAKYTVSVILSVLSVGCNIGSFVFIGRIAYILFSAQGSFKEAILMASFAVLCKLSSGVLLNISTYISHKAAYKTLKDIRNGISEKMLRLPLGYFEKNGSGRIKSVMVDRIESMEKTLAHMLPELTANLLCPCALIVYMFAVDYRLALIVLLWIMAGFSVTSFMMKNYKEKYEGQIAAFKGMNMAIVEFVRGIEVIKNFGRTDACYEKYENAVYSHAKYNVDWQKETQKYTSLGMAIAPFSLFPILIGGLIFYSNGTLEPNTLFMMIILSFSIFGPIMNASSYFDQLAGMGTDAKEIREILDCKELERGEYADICADSVSYENVSFSYEGEEKNAVNNLSFTVKKGSMLALAGESGSGKSTVAKLLAGYYDVKSGAIKINGRNIKEYSSESLNKIIAFVDQDTYLFDGTILDNIRIGKKDASYEEVCAVCKKAGCHEFISALPNGYETMAGEAGDKLSGGEKQRIAIARAMMKNAPILILDEATSSTDPENEAKIQIALSEAAKGKTLIVIAHRLPTIKNADTILFMDKGEVIAKGTNEELLANCEKYAKMYAISKEGER